MAAASRQVASAEFPANLSRPMVPTLRLIEPDASPGPSRKPQFRWEVSEADRRLIRVWR